jgi:hypothetical protein
MRAANACMERCADMSNKFYYDADGDFILRLTGDEAARLLAIVSRCERGTVSDVYDALAADEFIRQRAVEYHTNDSAFVSLHRTARPTPVGEHGVLTEMPVGAWHVYEPNNTLSIKIGDDATRWLATHKGAVDSQFGYLGEHRYLRLARADAMAWCERVGHTRSLLRTLPCAPDEERLPWETVMAVGERGFFECIPVGGYFRLPLLDAFASAVYCRTAHNATRAYIGGTPPSIVRHGPVINTASPFVGKTLERIARTDVMKRMVDIGWDGGDVMPKADDE